MSFSAESPPAGWYPDPAGSGGQRYWDGGSWSPVTRAANDAPGGYAPQPGQATGYSPHGQAQASQNTAPGQTGWGQAPYGAGMARQPVLAGFWWRVLAFILDNLILLLPLTLVQNLVAGRALDALSFWLTDFLVAASEGAVAPPVPEGIYGPLFLSSLISLGVYIAYRTILVTLQGGTLGQLITGLRVIPDGAPVTTKPDWGTSAIRATTAMVFWQIPVLGLVDVLIMLGSSKKQTLHDRIARTIVVKK